MTRRVAVYGEVDPNLVDGSSVWLQSICQVLASIEGVEVTLLLRRPVQPERRFLLDPLVADEAVELVDAGRPELLAPGEALDLLEELDRTWDFDVVLLRGQAVLAEAVARASFDGRLWSYAMPGRGMDDETLLALAARSARLLCQTEAAAEELRRILPGRSGSLLVLPPMIPDPDPATTKIDGAGEGGVRLAYAGKLAPEYCWLETVDAFRALREVEPDAELHVLGDKIHRPPDRPDFHDRALRALRENEGVRWHGAVSRSAVRGLLVGCDLALSIRDPRVEAARELSTKVLEYGAAGLPVVLNRAPAYEDLLGEDYPLFIDGPEDAPGLLTGPALDPDQRDAAAAACRQASREFTFSRVAARLGEHLPDLHQGPTHSGPDRPPQVSANGAGRVPCVLIAGHDLKFTGPIRDAIVSAGGTVAEDLWSSHTEHDEAASRAALERADVILCEWCLGNAAWYSRNKRPGQRLVIRLHRMELATQHPLDVEMDAVDATVLVSRHVLEDAVSRFGWDPAGLDVIPNAVDCDRLRRRKTQDAYFNLAMIGYVPRLKRLDRALDVLERLRKQEPRFRMTIVGRPPSDFLWVTRRPDEVEAFRSTLHRIQSSELLRAALTFRPFTADLSSLLTSVGWIISTSEVEGHQVTLAEGAASGAVPIILDRPGVDDQYPERWVHSNAMEAADSIAVSGPRGWNGEHILAADHATRWSLPSIIPRWRHVLGLDHAEVAVR